MTLELIAASRLVVVAVTVVVVLMPVLAMLQIVAIMELSLAVALKAFLYHSIRMALEWVAAFLLVAAAVVVVLMPVLAMLQGGGRCSGNCLEGISIRCPCFGTRDLALKLPGGPPGGKAGGC